jgi:hypothetical protein
MWTAVGISAAVLVTVVLALAMPAIERQLNRWQLLPQHEQLTELSLDSMQLPTSYQIGHDQTMRFTIHNRTNSAATYTYVITETNPAGTRKAQLATGSVTVAAHSTVTTAQTILPADLGKRVHVNLQLNTGLSVGYWTER